MTFTIDPAAHGSIAMFMPSSSIAENQHKHLNWGHPAVYVKIEKDIEYI
jgi:hypothetical protein